MNPPLYALRHIPVLACVTAGYTHPAPQPIIQLKELAVDAIRYDAWKASLERYPRPCKRRSAA